MIGVAIKEAREERRMTQQELGQVSFLSDKMISAVETGRRSLTKEASKIICKKLNNPRVYFEMASEITGDVFSLNWLDGAAVDLHRAAVREKIIEELSEAVQAITIVKTYKNPKICSGKDIEDVTKSIQEAIDVYNASAIYVSVMCTEFNLDIKEMFRLQKEKLINRGYLKGK